jgi:Squalene-hopene cyclase C-terminal domain/Prenyltransferase and squalene oxidase repeat
MASGRSPFPVQGRADGKLIARAALATLGLAIVGALCSPAFAGTPNPERRHSLESTVRFLQESQRPSGGFAPAGKKPSQSISAWVALALAAAGINPRDQATCGVDAYTFLEGHFREGFKEELAWPETATTAFERELLVVDATGTDPHDFADFDLVEEILARELPNGSFPYVPGGRGEINNTVFAMLALSPITEPAAQEAVQNGADWLVTQQNGDGGWSWEVKGSRSEVDLTGAAIEALNAAGRHDSEAQEKALRYLHEAQRGDGGFAEFPDEAESNVASTAWGVQGLWAAGENPETWLTGSGEATEEPLDYMESLQQPDGHIRWKASSDLNGIWMTAYVAPAFAGQALPIPAVPRSLPSASAVAATSEETMLPASCREPPPGGDPPAPGAESPKPGGGVIAGGGGEGAPLFSRPKPQSKGKTPGGARVAKKKNPDPTNHSKIRRGANAKQPTGTETSEPSDPGAAEEEVSAVGSGRGPRSPGQGRGGAGPGVPAVLAKAAQTRSGQGGREITGTLIGSPTPNQDGDPAFGAPGLRRAGQGGSDREIWVAAGIGGAALLVALGGAQWERRRQVVLP